jgi:hypothetical protein
MINGSAARSLPALELPPTPTTASTEPPATDLETTIGAVVADAVAVLAWGLNDCWRCGSLTPENREAAGGPLTKLALMQLAHESGDLDFVALAREAGRRELRRVCDADVSLFQRHGSAAVDAAVDFYINGILEIVGNAVRDERAIRAAWAS